MENELIYIKFEVTVSEQKYFPYKKTGTAEVETRIPVRYLAGNNFDAGAFLAGLIPAALGNLEATIEENRIKDAEEESEE